jgi:hypothetical protein
MLKELITVSDGQYRDLTYELFKILDIKWLVLIGTVSKNCAKNRQRKEILNKKIHNYVKDNIFDNISINKIIIELPRSLKNNAIKYYIENIKNIKFFVNFNIPINALIYGDIDDNKNIIEEFKKNYNLQNKIEDNRNKLINFHNIESSIHNIFKYVSNEKILKTCILEFLFEEEDVDIDISRKTILFTYIEELYDIYGLYDTIDELNLIKLKKLMYQYDINIYNDYINYVEERLGLNIYPM